jgi:hypothetical protein
LSSTVWLALFFFHVNFDEPMAKALLAAAKGSIPLITGALLAALITSKVEGSNLPERRKAHLIASTCALVALAPVIWLLVRDIPPVAEFASCPTESTDAVPPSVHDGQTPATRRDDAGCSTSRWIAFAFALTWMGLPLMALFAWMSGLTAVPSFYAMLRERAAERLRAAESARRDAELKLSVLAAQVEPHFLFNTLAGVRGAIASEPGRAVALIDRLAEYLRLTIPRLRDDGRSQSARLDAQFEIVAAYLALMQARLPRLYYRIDLPEALRAAQFPPLLLISLVENAVKHGVEPKAGPATITVAARRLAGAAADGADGEVLEVTVSDDGVGFRHGHGGGVGLTNVRARLAHLYGEAAGLTLHALDGGGVQAQLRLPLRWQEAAEGGSVALGAA